MSERITGFRVFLRELLSPPLTSTNKFSETATSLCLRRLRKPQAALDSSSATAHHSRPIHNVHITLASKTSQCCWLSRPYSFQMLAHDIWLFYKRTFTEIGPISDAFWLLLTLCKKLCELHFLSQKPDNVACCKWTNTERPMSFSSLEIFVFNQEIK